MMIFIVNNKLQVWNLVGKRIVHKWSFYKFLVKIESGLLVDIIPISL